MRVPMRGSWGRAAVAALVISGLTVLDGQPAQSATTTRTITASADAYVDNASSTTRLGGSTRLVVDGSPVRQVFVRFDLSTVVGPVQRARLRLHVANVTDGASPDAGIVAKVDGSWSESTITYANRPTVWGSTVATLGAVIRNSWVEVDVTAAVAAGATVTLGLRTTNADGAYFDSRETGANAPQLVVVSGTADTPSANAVRAACDGALVSSNVTVGGTALKEISGVDQSTKNPSIFWMHNDSGDSARVFAVDAAGVTQRVYGLSGATAIDWEDIAVGPGPSAGQSYLYVADIGDNAATRAQVVVYRVLEPTVGAGAATTLSGVDALTLRYPDGAHNAEALLVDPVSAELFIIEKVANGGSARVYRAPGNVAAGSVTTMSLVATVSLPSGADHRVTGADVSADGTQLAVRTYASVLLFARPAGTSLAAALTGTPCAGPTPAEVQGEAVAFHADGRGYVTISEGVSPVLHIYRAA